MKKFLLLAVMALGLGAAFLNPMGRAFADDPGPDDPAVSVNAVGIASGSAFSIDWAGANLVLSGPNVTAVFTASSPETTVNSTGSMTTEIPANPLCFDCVIVNGGAAGGYTVYNADGEVTGGGSFYSRTDCYCYISPLSISRIGVEPTYNWQPANYANYYSGDDGNGSVQCCPGDGE